MWFNNGMSTLNQTTLKMHTLHSLLGGEAERGITPVNELHERRVLEDLDFLPDRARDGQGKEQLDVLAQPVWFLKEAQTDRVVRAAQMQNNENDKHFFFCGYSHFFQVGVGIVDARQFGLRVPSFPQVAMLLRQLDEICNTAGAAIKKERTTRQKQTTGNRTCLNERKPIVADPVRRGHEFIISNPAPVPSL